MAANESARDEARDYLEEELHVTPEQLQDALQATYGDAYAAGVLAALQQDGTDTTPHWVGGAIPHTDADWADYWDSWTPGDENAANVTRDGGLATLLDQAGVTIQGIVGTLLDRLGNTLADGLAAGDSVDSIARSMTGIVNDPSRAWLIADTEAARAMSSAATDQYRQDGVTQVDLLTSPGACAECVDIASQNPHKTGDVQVPVHPRCRCSLAPRPDQLEHRTEQVGNPATTGRVDLGLVGAAAVGEDVETADAAEERAARHAEEEREAEALRESGGLEPPTTVPQPYIVPSAPAYYGENTGGGMELGEENTGGGMTLGEENTGGGGAAVNANQGGGLQAGQENTGSGTAYLPPDAATAPDQPVDMNPTAPPPSAPKRRQRKRTRGGKPIQREGK